ncbi:hypothetical protein ACVJBD_007706 [Rhizobium mongolense]
MGHSVISQLTHPEVYRRGDLSKYPSLASV